MTDAADLAGRVERCATRLKAPGLQDPDSRARFADRVSRAVELLSALADGEIHPEARRGPGPPFNPFAQALEETDRPEAVWLAFLATHLGWDRPDSCGVLYRGLTERPLWTWPAVSRDGGAAFARWVEQRWPQLRQLAPFGNHRKFFSHNPAVPVSTAWVVRSYVSWASDGLTRLLSAHGDPEEAFEVLYHSLGPVVGFGRTGQHDFLRLTGLLGLANIRPGRCYLKGASGPLRGAALMFLGREPDRGPVDWLEARCRELARSLSVDIQVVEEALCEWQKGKR